MKQSIQYILLSLGITALLALTGCNTMDGFGQDVENAGEEIQEGSN